MLFINRSVHIFFNLVYNPGDQIFTSGNYNAFVILVDETLIIAFTFVLVLLVNRRISINLEKELSLNKQAKAELSISEEKYSKIFKTNQYALVITRLSDVKFIEVNDEFVSVTGFTRKELLNNSTIGLDLWHNNEDRDRMLKALKQDSSIHKLNIFLK